MTSDPLHPSDFDETEYRPASLDSASDGFTPGSLVGGNYKLEKLLGRGGMGEAWKAFDQVASRNVVLKFVPKEIQHIQEAMDSVKDSFQKVHALQHQHICPVYDLFQDEQHGLCLAMKYIEGLPLDEFKRKRIEKRGKMSFSEVVKILWDIAGALDYSHGMKVIHRDIKPQNVMISPKDGVQIIDFGVAEEIRTSMAKFSELPMEMAGTRTYMAPEQWRGRLQDARTDQYALAVTAYELIAGQPPFRKTDARTLREAVLNDPPPSIRGLPEHVNAALLKGLAKKRDDRFPDCKSFIKAMATKPSVTTETKFDIDPNLQSDRGSGFTPPPVWVPAPSTKRPTSKPKHRSNGWMIGLGVAVVAAVGLGLLGFFAGKTSPPPKPDLAVTKPITTPPKPKKPRPVETPPPEEAPPTEIPPAPPVETPLIETPPAPEKPHPKGEYSFPDELTEEETERLQRVQERFANIPEATLKAELGEPAAPNLTSMTMTSGNFTPDGKHFFCVANPGKGCNAFDVETGRLAKKFSYTVKCTKAAVHPDGRIVAAAGEDGTIVLWDFETDEILREIKAHGGKILDLRFSPDGSRLVSGSEDKTAAIWSTDSGEEFRRFGEFPNNVRTVALTPDNKTLALVSAGTSLWNTETGKELFRINGYGFVLNHQGTVLAAILKKDQVVLWDVKANRPLKRLIGSASRVISLDFSPDDAQLAVTCVDGFFSTVWDIESAMPLYRLPRCRASGGGGLEIRFDTAGTMIALCYCLPIEIWETPTKEQLVERERNLKEKRETAKEILLRDMPAPTVSETALATLCHWRTIRSAGKAYENSLYTPCRVKETRTLSFRLDKKWRTFKTRYALLCYTDGPFGEARNRIYRNSVFVVRGDGKELFRSEKITDIDDRPMEVDVRGVTLLELVMEPQEGTSSHDAVWLTPTLSR